MNDIEIKVVNTIKIQSIDKGKKTTWRRFNMDVKLPKILGSIIDSYIDDVCKEIYAEDRGSKDWVSLIKKHTRSKQLRGWAASIIWWHYGGKGRLGDGVLYKLSKSFDSEHNQFKIKQVMMLLEKMGCPKSVNSEAAIREKKRTKKIKDYIKHNTPILIDWRKNE